VVGEIGSETGTGSSTHTHPAAATDNSSIDAGEDASEAKVKLKVADTPGLTNTSDSQHAADVTERQSAALYVSRLSQFIETFVNNATSSLDADRLLQEFSSNFCTGIAFLTPSVQGER